MARMQREKKASLKDAHAVFRGRLEGIGDNHELLCNLHLCYRDSRSEVTGGSGSSVRRAFSSRFDLCTLSLTLHHLLNSCVVYLISQDATEGDGTEAQQTSAGCCNSMKVKVTQTNAQLTAANARRHGSSRGSVPKLLKWSELLQSVAVGRWKRMSGLEASTGTEVAPVLRATSKITRAESCPEGLL